MIKAIIFDMDGLLINSEPIWFRARRELLSSLGYDWTWENQKENMGASTQQWVEYMYHFVEEKLSKENILTGITDRMKIYYSKGEIDLMHGANEALKYANENYIVGLASGSYKDLLYTAIRVNNWENIFQEILSSDDLNRGKPFPDIYLEIMKRLGVYPEECVVLEDSRDGIKAGVSAGAKVIAVPNKDIPVPQDVLDTASAVIESLYNFPEAMKMF